MDELLEQSLAYHRWANLRLLDVCASLDDKQVQWTAPGTYGSIAATWQHLLRAEGRYLMRLNGKTPPPDGDEPFPGMAELRSRAERSADELIAAAARLERGTSGVFEYSNERLRLSHWVFALQALHHGNDHRTHICTILGAHGFEYGEMDVWAFSRATGHEVEVSRA